MIEVDYILELRNAINNEIVVRMPHLALVGYDVKTETGSRRQPEVNAATRQATHASEDFTFADRFFLTV